MTRRLPLIAAWIIAGSAVAAGLFWALLQVPESSSLMLVASGLLAASVVVVLVWVLGGALRAWRQDLAASHALLRGLSALPAVLAGAAIFALIYWLTMRATDWHAAYAGQLDAWIIARTGKSDTARLHLWIGRLLWFLRWGIGLTLALSVSAWMTRDGVRAVAGLRWLTSALNPLRWLAVTALVGLGIAWPWQYAYWRPERLSIGAEPWFVIAKLTAMVVVAAIACALALRVVTPPAGDRT